MGHCCFAVMLAEAGIQKSFDIPGFRLALAIASLAGMTFELFNELNTSG
jgi:hypothetical protein